jgi:hypothetical protein
MLRFKIVGIGRRPMLIQRRTYLLISHSRTLLLLLLIVHLEPSKKLFRLRRPNRAAAVVNLLITGLCGNIVKSFNLM